MDCQKGGRQKYTANNVIQQMQNHQNSSKQPKAFCAQKSTALFKMAVAFHDAVIVAVTREEIKGFFFADV